MNRIFYNEKVCSVGIQPDGILKPSIDAEGMIR